MPSPRSSRPRRPAVLSLGALALSLLATACMGANAEEIGDVSTVFKFIGPNHKIVVDAYDDPAVNACASL
jgi:CreA protein